MLVTLAFGFATAVTKNTKFANFNGAERVVLVVSLGLFALSAVLAVTINLPKSYSIPDFRDRLGITDRSPDAQPLQRLENALEAGHAENDRKASTLALAFAIQLAAVATLALAVGLVTA